MIILHVSDFALTSRSLRWLVNDAPPHHLLAVSGNVVPADGGMGSSFWESRFHEEGLRAYRRPVAFCGGRMEAAWARSWRPLEWLRRPTPAPAPNHLWSAGDMFVMGGLSFWVADDVSLARPKPADVWITRGLSDSVDTTAEAMILRYRPRFVLSGSEDDAGRWCVRIGASMLLNPGCGMSSEVPPHILIDTGRREFRRSTGSLDHVERLSFDAVPPSVVRREALELVSA